MSESGDVEAGAAWLMDFFSDEFVESLTPLERTVTDISIDSVYTARCALSGNPLTLFDNTTQLKDLSLRRHCKIADEFIPEVNAGRVHKTHALALLSQQLLLAILAKDFVGAMQFLSPLNYLACAMHVGEQPEIKMGVSNAARMQKRKKLEAKILQRFTELGLSKQRACVVIATELGLTQSTILKRLQGLNVPE